jgi:GNAT superfamily N-acetyltransferase
MHPADLEATAAALARAFQDDPLQTYILPDAEERARRSPAHFASILRYGLLFGEVFAAPGRARGAAVVLPPDGWEITPERAAAAGFDQWPITLGAVAAERFSSALSVLEPLHHRDVPRAHWYVLLLGVAPDAQGTGLGRALLQPVFDRATAAGQPCYLETAQPKNVGFYEHLGFRVVVDMVEPTSGLRLWTFRRD